MGTCANHLLTLTDAARAALEHHFGPTQRPNLRVFLSFLDESGPRLDVAPDEPNATDTAITTQGWPFVINTLLLQQAAPVTVDFGPDGFLVHSGLDFSEAGGNCGGKCGAH